MLKIQGDQKVSVHMMIAIQKVTINVQSVPLPVSRHLLTRRIVVSKTVFSIARPTLRMYSVMAIFNSSILWGLFEYTEFFFEPQRKKSGGERSGDLGRPNGFRNDSDRKHVVRLCAYALHGNRLELFKILYFCVIFVL